MTNSGSAPEPGAEPADVPADPADRERLLQAMSPDAAGEHHELLRGLLAAEMRYRANAAEPQEYFENLYWCAFLLSCIADLADVPALWQAKQVNFDTASGLDVEALLGAGVGPTLAWLDANGHPGLAGELAWVTTAELDLMEWQTDRRRYFYP